MNSTSGAELLTLVVDSDLDWRTPAFRRLARAAVQEVLFGPEAAAPPDSARAAPGAGGPVAAVEPCLEACGWLGEVEEQDIDLLVGLLLSSGFGAEPLPAVGWPRGSSAAAGYEAWQAAALGAWPWPPGSSSPGSRCSPEDSEADYETDELIAQLLRTGDVDVGPAGSHWGAGVQEEAADASWWAAGAETGASDRPHVRQRCEGHLEQQQDLDADYAWALQLQQEEEEAAAEQEEAVREEVELIYHPAPPSAVGAADGSIRRPRLSGGGPGGYRTLEEAFKEQTQEQQQGQSQHGSAAAPASSGPALPPFASLPLPATTVRPPPAEQGIPPVRGSGAAFGHAFPSLAASAAAAAASRSQPINTGKMQQQRAWAVQQERGSGVRLLNSGGSNSGGTSSSGGGGGGGAGCRSARGSKQQQKQRKQERAGWYGGGAGSWEQGVSVPLELDGLTLLEDDLHTTLLMKVGGGFDMLC